MVGPDIESSNKGGDGDGLRQLENADHRSSAGFSEPDHEGGKYSDFFGRL